MPKMKTEFEIREAILNFQLAGLRHRYERKQRRDAFIKKNLSKILKLKTDGWPRTKEMPDYLKWLDLIYRAKLEGIYGIGTSNCDVIIQLSRLSKEMYQLRRNQNKP